MIVFTSIRRQFDRRWFFSWDHIGGDITYRVVLNGRQQTVLVASDTDTVVEYIFDGTGPYDSSPPPIEVVLDGEIAPTERDRPFVRLQWHNDFSSVRYDVEQYTGTEWVRRAIVQPNEFPIYSFTSTILANNALSQFRVIAYNETGVGSDPLYFTSTVVYPPLFDDASITIDYDEDTNAIIVQAV